nr:MAG TPA: hypothetical protein [Bacteriophage sp.]DAM19377.1 MAG TPA: hypothetical protein [Caudoviricetes sp.]
MAGPGAAVIGTAKQWHSRAAIGFDGKGDAGNCCERPSQATEWQGSARRRHETQWRGGAMTSSDGSGIDSYVRQGLRLLCVARA